MTRLADGSVSRTIDNARAFHRTRVSSELPEWSRLRGLRVLDRLLVDRKRSNGRERFVITFASTMHLVNILERRNLAYITSRRTDRTRSPRAPGLALRPAWAAASSASVGEDRQLDVVQGKRTSGTA